MAINSLIFPSVAIKLVAYIHIFVVTESHQQLSYYHHCPEKGETKRIILTSIEGGGKSDLILLRQILVLLSITGFKFFLHCSDSFLMRDKDSSLVSSAFVLLVFFQDIKSLWK